MSIYDCFNFMELLIYKKKKYSSNNSKVGPRTFILRLAHTLARILFFTHRREARTIFVKVSTWKKEEGGGWKTAVSEFPADSKSRSSAGHVKPSVGPSLFRRVRASGDGNIGGHPLNRSNDSRRRRRPYVFSLNRPINRRNRLLIEWRQVDCRSLSTPQTRTEDPPLRLRSVLFPFARK